MIGLCGEEIELRYGSGYGTTSLLVAQIVWWVEKSQDDFIAMSHNCPPASGGV